MTEITSPIKSYLTLVEFLISAKQKLYAIGAEKNLSGMQVLTILMLDEARPMHYFTKFFNCDPSNITSIVDALEDKGIAERTESKSDRRIKLISLNNKGQKLRLQLAKTLTDDEDFLLNRLTLSESQAFTKLIQKATEAR